MKRNTVARQRASDIRRSFVGSLELPTCKKCAKKIRKDQEREWLTDPMGLSHKGSCP